MSSTINGNVGGSAFSGANVVCSVPFQGPVQYAAADGSGNYSFTGLVAGTYIISANFPGFNYLRSHTVTADGSTTYGDVNLDPIAVGASDVNTGTIEIY